MSEENKYIDFKFDDNCRQHDVEVDFNDRRVKQHLCALVRGYGSTTENILIDFVNGTYGSIKDYDSVQEAWNKLDSEQQSFVLVFRNMMGKVLLGERKIFPHLFHVSLIRDAWSKMIEQAEEVAGEDSLSLDDETDLVVKAAKMLNESIVSESDLPTWSIETSEY